MNIKKGFYILLGFISMALGAVGAVIPILPTFPFMLFSAFCFAKSSEKLNAWFKGTKLYKNNFESFVKQRGMTKKSKIKIILTVTIMMSIGFLMMNQVVIGRIVLGIVWLFHLIYFIFVVKTISPDAQFDALSEQEENHLNIK